MPDHPSWRPCVKVPTKACLNDNRCMGIECVRLHLAPEDNELLTIEEKEVLTQLANVYASMLAIIGKYGVGDQREMVSHIHNLQRMVMAQAAARRYPGLYRALGELDAGRQKVSAQD